MNRRILIGYDDSDGAKDAVELAAVLAAEDAYVAAIEVLPLPGAPSTGYRLLKGAEFAPPAEYFAPATSRLAGREVEALSFVGSSPARTLAEFAVAEGIETIVVGAPHHGAVGRLLAGTVAGDLLRRSEVPVATAPRGFARHSHQRPRTIAVAYDGGAESRAALAHAAALALADGAGLEILTVDRPTNPIGGAITYTFSLPEDVDDIQRQALREVDPAIELRRRVLTGETAEALIDSCHEGIDLLVVGSRGHGPVERVLLGSTSSALIRHAACPVLVVPRPAAVPAGT